jgi:hypothetical protein
MPATATVPAPVAEKPASSPIPELARPRLILPTSKVPAEKKNPKLLVIFSKPKVGKTSALAGLENNLIIDLQHGTDYVEAMKVHASSVEDLREIGLAIKAAGHPYKYVTVDTATDLEDLCVAYGETLFSRTSQGKNWFTPESGGKARYGHLLEMPDGAGYRWLREAFEKLMEFVSKLAEHVIVTAHVKDKLLDKKDGSQFNSLEIDLTGRIKQILAGRLSDSIGYLYRRGNQNILSFRTSDEVGCGGRSPHLSGEIVLSEMNEDGVLVTHWDRIFIE